MGERRPSWSSWKPSRASCPAWSATPSRSSRSPTARTDCSSTPSTRSRHRGVGMTCRTSCCPGTTARSPAGGATRRSGERPNAGPTYSTGSIRPRSTSTTSPCWPSSAGIRRCRSPGRGSAGRRVQQAPAMGDRDGLGAAGGSELGQDVRDVDAGRLLRDEQLLTDLAVGETFGEQDEHLTLAGGEPTADGGNTGGDAGLEASATYQRLDGVLERTRAERHGLGVGGRGFAGRSVALIGAQQRLGQPPVRPRLFVAVAVAELVETTPPELDVWMAFQATVLGLTSQEPGPTFGSERATARAAVAGVRPGVVEEALAGVACERELGVVVDQSGVLGEIRGGGEPDSGQPDRTQEVWPEVLDVTQRTLRELDGGARIALPAQ